MESSTCGSTNIRKMSGAERGASIDAFGIFSKKIKKNLNVGIADILGNLSNKCSDYTFRHTMVKYFYI